jgi:hypothetical protein
MMTLKRFRKLADSYGADLRRWPERLRPEARRLLESSAQARQIIGGAGELDDALIAAAAARSDSVWSGDDPEDALLRLRNGVAARIRTGGAPATAIAAGGIPIRTPRNAPRRVGWISLATAASVAILAGLVLGIRYSPAAPQQDLLALLQPAPVQLLSD